MTKKTNATTDAATVVGVAKVPALRLPINSLVILSAFEKHFSTGTRGFFGQAVDPATGKKYQIVGAVELGSKGT